MVLKNVDTTLKYKSQKFRP